MCRGCLERSVADVRTEDTATPTQVKVPLAGAAVRARQRSVGPPTTAEDPGDDLGGDPSRVALHLEVGNPCVAVDEVVVVLGVEHCGLEVVTGKAPDAVE